MIAIICSPKRRTSGGREITTFTRKKSNQLFVLDGSLMYVGAPEDGVVHFVTGYPLISRNDWLSKQRQGPLIWRRGQECPKAEES
jgi:hypothetical protein